MATQFLFVVGFVFKQDTQQSQLGTEHNKSCFPLCSKPNSTALSPPPALPSHHSGYCVQTLVLLPSHRNLSQIHPNTRPISTQSVVLFQIPCMAFSPFSSLKRATPNYYHENIYNLQFTKTFFWNQATESCTTQLPANSHSLLFYVWPHQGFTSFQKRAAFTRLTSGYFLTYRKGWDLAKKSPHNSWSPRPYMKQFCMLIQVKVINWHLTLVHQKPTYATIIYLLNEALASGQRISGLCLA